MRPLSLLIDFFDMDIDKPTDSAFNQQRAKLKQEALTSFDFIEYGSKDTYCVTFRVVRFPIADGSYECVVTNLPRDKFPPACVRKLYKSWKR